MALKTFVKVGAINNLSDARYCAGMEVNLIGFNLEKESPEYIPPETFKELTEWLSGVAYVGEFQDYDEEEIQQALRLYNVDYVQVSDINLVKTLKEKELSVILMTSVDDLPAAPIDVDYLLLTNNHNELLQSELEVIHKYSEIYNILLGSGVNDRNVEFILERSGAKGIALQGGSELRPGYKDYDELADILEALEINDLI